MFFKFLKDRIQQKIPGQCHTPTNNDLIRVKEICYDGIDNDADSNVDCGDSDCDSNLMCGADINVLTGGYGTLDPLEALMLDMFSGIEGPPISIGTDPINDTANQHLEIIEAALKQTAYSIILGIGVMEFNTTFVCSGSEAGKYYYFLDIDENATNGCNATINDTAVSGFEYKIERIGLSTKSSNLLVESKMAHLASATYAVKKSL